MEVMRFPKKLQIDITSRCNLRCSYCYFFSGPADVKQDLTTKEWLTFFDEMGRNKILTATLAGGEPFIREDLKELIRGIIKNKIRFSLLSNGTLINEEMSSWLASTGRCDFVQVSLDGSKPETHESFRGSGTFVKALQGIENLRKFGVSVKVRVTIHKKNFEDLDQVAKLLLEEIGLPSFSTNSAGYIGLCRQGSAEIQLSAQERSRTMDILIILNRKYKGRISASAGPLAEARMWSSWERRWKVENNRRSSMKPGRLRSCSGVFSKMAVRSDGVMTPCTQISHIELGRVNRDNLTKAWQNHPEMKRLRERGSISLDIFEYCRGCDYIAYCSGGCPSLVYNTLNTDEHPDPNTCLRKFFSEGGRLPDQTLLTPEKKN